MHYVYVYILFSKNTIYTIYLLFVNIFIFKYDPIELFVLN